MEDVLLARESNYLYRQGLLFFTFFLLTPIVLFSSALSLVALTKDGEKNENVNQGVHIFAAIPESAPLITSEIIAKDARVSLIDAYLTKNNSPLQPYAKFIVETSDKNKLDYRLLVAIAQKESGLCRVIPPGGHNCWGWGIHSKGTLGFESWEEGILTVSNGLKEKYIDMGYTDPDKIMKKYAHPDSTTWADGVKMYMEQISNQRD